MNAILQVLRFLFMPKAFCAMLFTAAVCAHAQDIAPRQQLLCATDQPLVHVGGTVVVRAWVVDENEQPATRKWQWRAEAGIVTGDSVAEWRFGTGDLTKAGQTLTATVETTANRTPELMRCTVELILTENAESYAGITRGNEAAARAFLLASHEPPIGYGMYSFLLLDSPALSDVDIERHVSAIAIHLLLIQPAAEMLAYRRIGQLNLALLPLTRQIQLPDRISSMAQARKVAETVLQNYDYARAHGLLIDFCVQASGSGPFLIASRIPEASCQKENLLMDMSRIMPNLIPDWIRTFRSLATAERSWGSDTMTKVTLNTRNVIASTYRDTSILAQTLTQWVRQIDKR